MKTLLSILLALLGLEAWATEQEPDILFYQGKRFELYASHSASSPLESFSQVSEKLFQLYQSGASGCWRQYTAEWVIVDGQLYLTKVMSCENGKVVNALVEKAINRKFIRGRMKADWVNGIYWGGRGEKHWRAFENEIKFSFQNGTLVSTQLYISPECSFQNKDTLHKFIYSTINWEVLPDTQHTVAIAFETNENGKVVQAEVQQRSNPVFEKEALRVLQTVPCWKVFTSMGEVWGERDIEIVFSEEIRMKYAR